MSLKFFLEYFFIKLLLLICKLFPKKIILIIFKLVGSFSYLFLFKRRKIALKNIELAFPKINKKEKRKIIKKSFHHFSEVIAYNFLVLCNKINKFNIDDIVESNDLKKLISIVDKSSEGTLFLTGHIGNWECLSQFLSIKLPKKFYAIARHMKNPLIDRKIVNPIRDQFNVNTFPKKNAIIRMLKILKKDNLAGILIDQKLNDKMHVKIKFFDKYAKSTPLPAILQIRYKTPIVFVYMIKNSFDKYELFFHELNSFDTRNKTETELVYEITSYHHKILENIIKKYPDQWLWMHNRWKE